MFIQLFSISEGEDSRMSLGNLCLCSVTLTVVKKFHDVQAEPPVFQCVPITSSLSLGTTEKRLAQSSLHSPFVYLYILIISLLSFLFCVLNSPTCLSLSSCERCFSPLINLSDPCWTVSISFVSSGISPGQNWT